MRPARSSLTYHTPLDRPRQVLHTHLLALHPPRALRRTIVVATLAAGCMALPRHALHRAFRDKSTLRMRTTISLEEWPNRSSMIRRAASSISSGAISSTGRLTLSAGIPKCQPRRPKASGGSAVQDARVGGLVHYPAVAEADRLIHRRSSRRRTIWRSRLRRRPPDSRNGLRIDRGDSTCSLRDWPQRAPISPSCILSFLPAYPGAFYPAGHPRYIGLSEPTPNRLRMP